MSGTERFPTAQDALEYRQAHDKRVKELHRMTAPKLREIDRQALAVEGLRRVAGGPQSKDELERAILNREYPIGLLNESIHVLYHKPGETWEACKHCGGE